MKGVAAFLFACVVPLCACSSDPDGSELDDPNGSGANGSGGSGNNSGSPVDVGNGASAGTGTSGPTIDEACATSKSGTQAEPAVLQLVVDTSLSMNDSPDGRGPGNGPGGGWGDDDDDDDDDADSESKWETTRAALLQALPLLSADTAVGLSFYPDTDSLEEDCIVNEAAVPISTLGTPGVQDSLVNALNSAEPGGGTPTHDAYNYGVSLLQASNAAGRKFLLLITDGTPTFPEGCGGFNQNGVDTQPLIDAAAAAYAQGISTYVIGSPGSEGARDSLSEIASVGGTAKAGCSDAGPEYCHFDMTEEEDLGAALTTALEQIVGSIVSCEYPFPDPPEGETLDPSSVNVLFTASDGQTITVLKDQSDTCTNGWQDAPDGSGILLCSATCDAVRNDPAAQIEVLFGCATQEVTPR